MSFDGPRRWSLRSEPAPRAQRRSAHLLDTLTRALGGAGAWMKRRPKRSALIALLLLAIVVAVVLVFWRSTKRDPEHFRLRADVPADSSGFATAIYQSLGVRMEGGHRIELLQNGAVFTGIEQSIRAARSSIHIVMYIWEKGAASQRLSRAIVERARAGVRCRLLVDDFGSPAFKKDVAGPLTQAGCDVRYFRPMPGVDKLARNHRKLVIVDGTVAVTGGLGVRDDWLGDGVHDEGWRDDNVRFTGPTVQLAQQAFAENWQEAGGPLLPADDFRTPTQTGHSFAALVSSTASPVLTRSERLTQLMISAAKRRLWIANAYFVPSKAILDLIASKASAGVDVRILAPGKKSDSKTSFGAQHVEYGALLKKGVRVWEYQPSMMHAKTMLVDERLVSIGSANLDPLSLSKLEEVTLVVDDRAVAVQLERSFLKDCSHAKEHKED
jgi:cardiolipin synthase A/B